MPRLRYLGRDEEGEPIWVDPADAPPLRVRKGLGKPHYEMSQAEQVMHGYKQLEEKGWKSAYSKQDILRTWKAEAEQAR